ncbi:DUF3885 domain-containing protein [Thermoactinomyces sp. DSM 45892]|uniref:DUF3885 domain-containing protein n=1 Tax=Thermoactinomyces sp. DSM 45892 TaxID=1882753 RepID=UPI00089C3DAE|nr:DUF3885 domain-containing protein [Thermoactinomyces sp. DSM 45892]SDZ27189.1 Transposase DDE domain-containing protein [Thermoactinomyces sp. DSM 45892]
MLPKEFRHRRNKNKQKQEDVSLIAVCLMGKMLGFKSERQWHAFIVSNLFFDQPFPERLGTTASVVNFNERLKFYGIKFTRRFVSQAYYTIIDSVPLPICHYTRASCVRLFQDVANYGYCASKREHYYGLKGSFQITDHGYIVSYGISAASVHDVTVVEELVEQAPHPYVQASSRNWGLSRKRHAILNTFLRAAEYYGIQETFDELFAKSRQGKNFHRLYHLILSADTIRLDDIDYTITNRYCLKCNVGDFRSGTYLRDKVDEDIYGDSYLINLNRGLIFYFYDDRGMDIVATRKDVLAEIYTKYSDWILEYDRKKIGNLFHASKR